MYVSTEKEIEKKSVAKRKAKRVTRGPRLNSRLTRKCRFGQSHRSQSTQIEPKNRCRKAEHQLCNINRTVISKQLCAATSFRLCSDWSWIMYKRRGLWRAYRVGAMPHDRGDWLGFFFFSYIENFNFHHEFYPRNAGQVHMGRATYLNNIFGWNGKTTKKDKERKINHQTLLPTRLLKHQQNFNQKPILHRIKNRK